jgi:DtxR family Mn-dependent transcriptional regulator
MDESISAREEDYLKAIYRLAVGGPVSPGDLVNRLGVSGAAVSKMTTRLAHAELVRRTAYQGVTLTERGQRSALRVLRHHRLVEVWLVEQLGYGWDEVDAEAELLEHTLSEKLAARLEAALNFPRYCPHGDPIPNQALEMEEVRERPLTTMPLDYPCLLSRVVGDGPMLRHLREIGLTPGTPLTVVARAPVGGLLTVALAGRELPVSPAVAAAVFVRRPSEA